MLLGRVSVPAGFFSYLSKGLTYVAFRYGALKDARSIDSLVVRFLKRFLESSSRSFRSRVCLQATHLFQRPGQR